MLTLPRFEWSRPATVAQALDQLAAAPGETLVIAGGTDAVPNLKHRLHEPRRVVHLGGVDELRGIRVHERAVEIGALVTLAELAAAPEVADWPALRRAAGLVAGPQLRNMGTVGGNLCLDTRCTYYNQTYFWREALGFCLKKDGEHCHVVPQGRRCVAAHSSDVAPVLISLGAEVEIAGRDGRRRIAVDDFFVADGVHNNVLRPDELVTAVIVPAAASGLIGAYDKVRPRRSIDFPMLSVAFAARRAGAGLVDGRLVVGALAARPRRVSGLETVLDGRPIDEAVLEALGAQAARQCRPQSNIPYDVDWRHAIVPVTVKRVVRAALGAA